MSDGFDVSPETLDAYAANLQQLQAAFDAIGNYVTTAGCDKAGFTGLLSLLQPVVELVDSLYQETLDFGRDRLSSLTEGIGQAAERYRSGDKASEDVFTKILTELDTTVDVVP